MQMYPDLSQMEEVKCPDCGQPLYIVIKEGQPYHAIMGGCRCDRQVYEIPRGSICAGMQGGTMIVYKPKASEK